MHIVVIYVSIHKKILFLYTYNVCTRNQKPFTRFNNFVIFCVSNFFRFFVELAEVSNHALFQLTVLGTQVEFKNCPIKPGIFDQGRAVFSCHPGIFIYGNFSILYFSGFLSQGCPSLSLRMTWWETAKHKKARGPPRSLRVKTMRLLSFPKTVIAA